MRWFWIDRFTEFVASSHAEAVKAIALSEDHLHDHFLGFPVMPNSLVTEGIAQAGGLLVSEHYRFSELVVLAKISRARFEDRARHGDLLRYRVTADWIRGDSAQISATATIDGRPLGEVELLYARLGSDAVPTGGARLFRPRDLKHWLTLVGVFDVGVRQDGTRLQRSDYPLEEPATV